MSKPFLRVTSDLTDQLSQALSKFKEASVLVGIPSQDNERIGPDRQAIGNAAILAINHFGSPMNNIPPRPVLTIGIRNARDQITDQFKLMAQKVLSLGPSAVGIYLERVGIIASNSAKKVINDQDSIPGPAASTLAARARRGFRGTKSLVISGQLRNAITYIIQGAK